jgi:fumarate hydratase class I
VTLYLSKKYRIITQTIGYNKAGTDFIQSIADAFQFIYYYHPVDYIKALAATYML